MNALKENLSGIGITSFSDVFLSEKFPRFIVSQVNANKSVDLIGRLKATRILVLKLSKFRNPKALRLMTLMRLFVASSLAFE